MRREEQWRSRRLQSACVTNRCFAVCSSPAPAAAAAAVAVAAAVVRLMTGEDGERGGGREWLRVPRGTCLCLTSCRLSPYVSLCVCVRLSMRVCVSVHEQRQRRVCVGGSGEREEGRGEEKGSRGFSV